MRKIVFLGFFVMLSGIIVLNSCKKVSSDDEEKEKKLTKLEQAKKDYEDHYIGTKVSSISWTGNEAACNSGDVSSSTRKKVVERVNYYRALCGLPSVKLNSTQNKSCQDAALNMMANDRLSHTPANTSKCYTPGAYAAASTGNIAIGWGSAEDKANHSINAVSGYMEDPGAHNKIVGHRAWLLARNLSEIGTGSVYDANHAYTAPNGYTYHKGAANCIRWGDNRNGSSTAGPEFIAYPAADYMPSTLIFDRWHFALPNANFNAAKVSLKDANGKTYVCNVIARETQGGGLEARIVWEPKNLSIASDINFTVTVSNISGTSESSYTYTVKVFKVQGVARKSESQEGKMLIL